MTQITLTQDERIHALRGFGYSEREAAFLCLAALHSGYFQRRQYGQFLGKGHSGTANALIQKAVALDHVKVSTYATSACVYHLCTRPFYEAIGQADNRNRRERQPLSIKNRLMSLDFVLDHPDRRFLATEHEKLDYLAGLKIERSIVPAKHYASRESDQSTTRYFIEKYPMFVANRAPDGTQAELGFCFVDEGARTTSRFETFLHHYQPLFTTLAQFRIVYVAAGPLLFAPAERAFSPVFGRANRHRKRPPIHGLPSGIDGLLRSAPAVRIARVRLI